MLTPVRVFGILIAAAFAMLLGPAPAFAAEPGDPANFMRQGSRVYEVSDVSLGCRLIGRCDGAAAALDAQAVPQYLSLRPGEGVGALCSVPGLVRVRGYFDGPEREVEGWAYPSDLALRRQPQPC